MSGVRERTPWGNVLHVCTRFQRGGSERRIRDIVTALPEMAHTVIVGEDSDLLLARQLLAPAQVDQLSTLRRPLDPRADLATVLALRRQLEVARPSVVVTHQSKAAALTRLAASGSRVVPLVHSLSMASFGEGYGRAQDWAFRLVERWLGRRTPVFAAVGRDLADRYTALGIPRDRFQIVRSGVPLPTLTMSQRMVRRDVRRDLEIPPTAAVILFVGSLDDRKGVTTLPDLLRGVTTEHTDRVDLVVAGDGHLREQMAQLAHAGPSDRIHLLGHVDPIEPLLWAADVMVLPSRVEGLPQVLVQAAATGLPFAAYDVDGVNELLAMGAHGRAVPLDRLSALTDAVAALLKDPRHDPVIDLDEWAPEAIQTAYRKVLLPLVETPIGTRAEVRSQVPILEGR